VKRRAGRDTSTGTTISVNDLTIFQADGSTIVDGASLSLIPGRVYALFGSNGVGKSTLVRCVADGRLELPKDCRVHLMDQLYDPEELAEYNNCIEFLAERDERLNEVLAEVAEREELMENDASVDAAVVAERLSGLYDLSEELEQRQRERCSEALAAVGFGEKRMARRPRLLSGGWQMRLRVAAAVLCRPQLLILDEPTNFLDLEGIRVLAELVQNVLKQEDSIVVVISHDRAFLEAVSTDTILMARKTLQQQAVPFGVFLEAARDREAHQNARYEKQQMAVQRFRATIANIQGHLRSGKTRKGAGAVTSRQVKLELISIGATNKTESGKVSI
jgi:ATPase subunit of ABC transporter with duplicated ATPase domains